MEEDFYTPPEIQKALRALGEVSQKISGRKTSLAKIKRHVMVAQGIRRARRKPAKPAPLSPMDSWIQAHNDRS